MSQDAVFKRLMREYERVHGQVVRRREETKRLNVRYNALKKQVMLQLQQRQKRHPNQQHLIFRGHDGDRYKLKATTNTSKGRIGQKMLQKNLKHYTQRYPQYQQAVQSFYVYLEERCRQGGKRQTKLSRTKLRRTKKVERRRSAPTRRRRAYSDEAEDIMTPDMLNMLQRVQSAHRLSDREHSL